MKKHGCFWWLFIGWWWWPTRAVCYDLPKLLVKGIIRAIKQAQKPAPVKQAKSPAPVSHAQTAEPVKQVQTPAPVKHTAPPAPPKLPITKEALNTKDVMARYASNEHYKSPSAYNFFEYHRAEFDCLLQSIPRAEIALSNEKVLRNKEIRSPYEKTAPITKRTPVNKLKNFVTIDVETTGLKVGGNDIIEVSAIKFENFAPVSIFTTLLKPRNPIPPDASRVSGITDDMVESSPRFAQIKNSLLDFIGELPLVAHNAAFDVKFLYVSGLNFPEAQVFFDTLELSRQHVKDYDGAKLDSYKLADVCAECCIYFDGAHRASADALATGLLFLEIIRKTRDVASVFDLLLP